MKAVKAEKLTISWSEYEGEGKATLHLYICTNMIKAVGRNCGLNQEEIEGKYAPPNTVPGNIRKSGI